jgi:hypothetical protein
VRIAPDGAVRWAQDLEDHEIGAALFDGFTAAAGGGIVLDDDGTAITAGTFSELQLDHRVRAPAPADSWITTDIFLLDLAL